MSALREAAQQALEFVTSEVWGTTPYMDVRVYEDAAKLRYACEAALAEPVQEPAQEPAAWATEIIDALQAQYDTEMIKENDSGDALIRLDDAIAAVEDAEKHYTASPKPEPAQEPVAWMVYTEGGTSAYVTDNPNDLVGAYRALPLYTAPPQRPPLTDEEIDRLWHDHGAGIDAERFARIARAIESKVRGEA